MSLINQMLADLEKRRSREDQAASGLLREVRTTARRKTYLSTVYRPLLVFFLLAAALVIIVLALRHGRLAEQEPLKTAADRVMIPAPPLPSAEPDMPPAAGVAKAPEETAGTTAPAAVVPFGNADAEGTAPPDGGEAQAKGFPPAIAQPGHSRQERSKGAAPDQPAVPEPGAEKIAPAAAAPLPQSPPAARGTLRVVHPLTPREEAERELLQAREALSAGRFTVGEAALRRVLALIPDHLAGRELLADALLSLGRPGEAEEVLRQGLQIASSHPPFLQGYARLLAGRGAWEEAGKLLQRVEPPLLSIDPDFHALAAAVHQRLGDYSAAADIYRELVQLRPANGTWWVGLGIALEGAKMPEKAREAFERGLDAGGLNQELSGYARDRLAAIRN